VTTYALINPQGAIDRQSSTVTPDAGVRSGWKWLPVEDTEAPAFNAGLEQVSFVYAVGETKVTRSWTRERKPLTDQKAAVKAEAQRRIIALTGRLQLIDCMIKQSNANMRANELNDKRILFLKAQGDDLTAAEELEATALRNLADAIQAIRAASDVVEALDPIPLDYTANSHWP
jgi:hypothetical protein